MTYPYVQAAFDYGTRQGPALAFLVHMAEGGGTVGFLARNPDRGVSVHYVIEYSGRIVQMLHEDRTSGSLNPREIRTGDDADGFFGATAAKAVMGSWWSNPNNAVISLEIEGFAVAGPNPAQHASLIRLVNDVRTRYPLIGVLGHRDFQDYKSCPGRHIDWASLGGHGPHKSAPAPSPEEPMGLALHLDATADTNPLDAFGTAKIKGTAHAVIRVSDRAYRGVADGLDLGIVQKGQLVTPLDNLAGNRRSVVAFNNMGETYVALLSDVTFTPLPVPPDLTPYSKADVNAAVHHLDAPLAAVLAAQKEALIP